MPREELIDVLVLPACIKNFMGIIHDVWTHCCLDLKPDGSAEHIPPDAHIYSNSRDLWTICTCRDASVQNFICNDH